MTDTTHFVGDDCPDGHLDDMQVDTFREPVEIRKCRKHPAWRNQGTMPDGVTPFDVCVRCGHVKNNTLVRRGRTSRNYGTRAELTASRKYGGMKVGAAGGPVDIRGKDWNVQMKTHRRLPPTEWRKAFQAMSASGERMPRLLLRFVMGSGVPPVDYMVIPGDVWLDWFGKDE